MVLTLCNVYKKIRHKNYIYFSCYIKFFQISTVVTTFLSEPNKLRYTFMCFTSNMFYFRFGSDRYFIVSFLHKISGGIIQFSFSKLARKCCSADLAEHVFCVQKCNVKGLFCRYICKVISGDVATCRKICPRLTFNTSHP